MKEEQDKIERERQQKEEQERPEREQEEHPITPRPISGGKGKGPFQMPGGKLGAGGQSEDDDMEGIIYIFMFRDERGRI